MGVSPGVAPGLGAVVGAEAATDEASAQSGFTVQIRDGAVTSAKLDTATRERLPRWAVVAATTGSLTRAQGATTSAKRPIPASTR